MVLDALAARYAGLGQVQLLVTDVTRMNKGAVCVAGIDLTTGFMVRPLQGDGSNWDETKWVAGAYFQVGRVVGLDPIRAERPTFPHATEDLRVAMVYRGDSVAPAILHAACVETAAADLDQVFDSQLIDDKYAVEGTRCRSLGSLIVDVADVHAEHSYGVKLVFRDRAGIRHYLKVTELETSACGDDDAGSAALQARLDQATGPVAIRLGLARPWAGPAGQRYDPRRCYIQLNGLILPG